MSEVQYILRKSSTGAEIPVSDGLVAGRLEDSGLVLTEGHPSRQHARFSKAGATLNVEDLGSSNGTFVNDERITGIVALNHGDKVRFDIEEYEFAIVGNATIARDPQATVIRKLEPVEADVDGSERRERPAWIDPAKQAEGGPKTEFIDAAAMKQMIEVDARDSAEPADDVDVPMLLVTSGNHSGQRFNLRSVSEQGEWTIGCDDDRDIALEDQGVSGIHAKLSRDGMRWKLTDQMSANGTFVNGRRSNMSYLNNGDRIRFGPVDCVFRTPEAFGTATRVSAPEKPKASTRNVILAILGFLITLAVIFAALQLL